MNKENKKHKIIIVFIGLLIKILTPFIPKKKNLWILGAQSGKAFIENSKYLFLYILQNQPNILPIWITQEKSVIEDVRKVGGTVYNNFSLNGIFKILRASVYCFSTQRGDVLFYQKTKKRKIINLWHGMPIKKIVYDYNKKDELKGNGLVFSIWETFAVGFKHEDVDVISSTSEFYKPIMQSAFRNSNIKITGQPRNDLFFLDKKEEIKSKLNFGPNYIITYMPTHRAYGRGSINPYLFLNNDEAKKYFIENKILVLLKFHKNMLSKHKILENDYNSPIIDISKSNYDPQEILYISDILITDYSSCFIDYLLLNRPVLFYKYDNYEEQDNELYFKLDKYNPGRIVDKEEKLLEEIKSIYSGNDECSHKRNSVNSLFNYYTDGKSSERIINHVMDLLS